MRNNITYIIKYPIYIVSKNRADVCYTAKMFMKDNVKFLIAVESEDYSNYLKYYDKKYLLKLPFSNLNLGSTPARNYCFEHSIKAGYKKHWLFDDNIRWISRFNKGYRIRINTEIALSIIESFSDRYENLYIAGMNYEYFVTKKTKYPYVLNTHVYSGMLIDNKMPFRWRLKYNEDIDLCFQVLSKKYCTILFNAFLIKKISTVEKLKGGNQTDLYKGNRPDKKILKAKSIQEIWPQYVKLKIRFKRYHHDINWKKYFSKNILKRKKNINWDIVKNTKHNIKLIAVDKINSKELKKYYNKYSENENG